MVVRLQVHTRHLSNSCDEKVHTSFVNKRCTSALDPLSSDLVARTRLARIWNFETIGSLAEDFQTRHEISAAYARIAEPESHDITNALFSINTLPDPTSQYRMIPTGRGRITPDQPCHSHNPSEYPRRSRDPRKAHWDG